MYILREISGRCGRYGRRWEEMGGDGRRLEEIGGDIVSRAIMEG